jgi:hypothetical protein
VPFVTVTEARNALAQFNNAMNRLEALVPTAVQSLTMA